MKYFSILLFFSLLACTNQNSEESFEEKDIVFIESPPNTLNDKNINWKYQISKILDSLTIKDICSKDKYSFVIKNFIDTNQYYFDPKNLDFEFFKKMIQVDKFNNFMLVQLKHPHGSKLENDIEVIILNEKYGVLSRDTLLGNRYWIGNIKITDWNEDGKDELVYNYDAPVSSVAIMNKYEEVYLFSKETSKLNQIFRLETEEFNCGPGDSSLITRTYLFEGKNKIKVKQKNFIINCNTARAKKPKEEQQKRIISTSTYYLKWNDKKNRYEENKDNKS